MTLVAVKDLETGKSLEKAAAAAAAAAASAAAVQQDQKQIYAHWRFGLI